MQSDALGSLPLPDLSRPDAERLRELAPLLDAPSAELVTESPVALSRGDAGPLACELHLADGFEPLAQVCAHPRMRLTRREEIVSLQRARRVGQRSIVWLAGHPAAWAGRRGRGPIPERVLAEQPYPIVDIYENRVVATLVDRIDRHLLKRIRALEDVRRRNEERRLAKDGSWRMYGRVTALWAESWSGQDDVDGAGDAVEQRLAELRGRHRQIRGLRRRPGYADVPAPYRAVRSLRLTNIFRGDDRYHDVARLWPSFAEAEVDAPTQELERATRRGHAAFVRLLVLRAIDAGLAESLLDPLREQSAPIERGENHVIRIAAPGAPPLDIVSIYCASEPKNVAGALGGTDRDVLAVVQPPGEEPAAPAWRAGGGRLVVVAESPAHLRAVESIGAALRFHVLGARYIALPPRLGLPEFVVRELVNAGVPCTPSGGATLLLGPAPAGALELVRERLLPSLMRGAERQRREQSWAVASKGIAEASRSFDRALPCPTPLCGKTGRLTTVERDRVVISCASCGGRWGMQRCPRGHPVPFALAGDDAQLLADREAEVDASFDVLGLQLVQPIGIRDGRFGTLCRSCDDWTVLPLSVKAG